MIKQTVSTLSAFALVSIVIAPPVDAKAVAKGNDDALHSQARTGSFGNTSAKTNNFHRSNSSLTYNQRLPRVQVAGLGGLAEIHGPRGRNGLPPTSMDSFVENAGAMKDRIYGDEGSNGPPPFQEFTQDHRIESGIRGSRAAGLTTGHGSKLPNAWGGDEFVKNEPFTQAGSSSGGSTWSTPASVGVSSSATPAYDLGQAEAAEGSANALYETGRRPLNSAESGF